MEDPNCRRINELKKPDYSSATYAVPLSLASAYLESLLVKNKTQERQLLIFKTLVWRKILSDPLLFVLSVLKETEKKSLFEIQLF